MARLWLPWPMQRWMRMVTLKPPPADWEDAILQTAVQFMNAEVCFYREVDPEPGEAYNPVTGEGGSTEIDILWRGKARVQQLRSPREFQTQYQAEATRFFRYQLDPADNPPQIPFGVKSRVLNGARDKDLESLVLVTNSGINSSHMAVRTIELSSNMEFVIWDWLPPDHQGGYGYGGYGE